MEKIAERGIIKMGYIVIPTIASTDDAYVETTVGIIDLTGHNLIIGQAAGKAYHSAIRFQNVTIRRAAKILSARVAFPFQMGTNSHYLWKVYGEAADNPSGFSTYADFMGRALTTAFLSITMAYDHLIVSPLEQIIQEIVNRSGWVSGNSLVIFFRGDDAVANTASPFTYDEDPADPAGHAGSLQIEYEDRYGMPVFYRS
jgi:hypothetical protein